MSVSPSKRLSLVAHAEHTSRSFADLAARVSPKLGKRISVLHEALFPDAERQALDAALDAALDGDTLPRFFEDDVALREEVATLQTQLFELKVVNEALHTEVTDLCNLVHHLRGECAASQAAVRELREGALWDVQIEGVNAWDRPPRRASEGELQLDPQLATPEPAAGRR